MVADSTSLEVNEKAKTLFSLRSLQHGSRLRDPLHLEVSKKAKTSFSHVLDQYYFPFARMCISD